MSYLGAGLLAAGSAWLINRFVLRYFGEQSIIWIIPWLEEIIKTSAALFMGVSLMMTHGIFGLVEAVHDYVYSPKWGFFAGLASIVSHWFYGWLTYVIYTETASWPFSVVCVGSLHVLWNILMVRLFTYYSGLKR
jgi:hypothetical protein